MRMYQMKGHFEGFPKLVIYRSCRSQRRRNMLSNVQTHYRKVTKERPKNPEIFVIIIFPALTMFYLITARNGGHCTNLGNDSAEGFSDAVVGDSFAIERAI